MELRHPPMPTEEDWQKAVRRAKPMFGQPLPEYRMPAAVSEFAATVRSEARQYAPPAAELVNVLHNHAAVLGIDPDARTGRLATARRVAKLLREISAETDDVVVVGMMAEAEVGDIGDQAAGTAFKQAGAVTQALADTHWPLLEAIRTRATTDERAEVVLDELRLVAAADQAVHDLGDALRKAVTKAADILAKDRPAEGAPVDPRPDRHRSRTVSKPHELPDLMAGIEQDLTDGHTVRVSWEVIP
jgi:hypothetical protein